MGYKIVSIAIKDCRYYKGTNKYFIAINGIILYWGTQVLIEKFQEP